MLTVSELHIYPIKSLGGTAVDAATITSRGLQNDRRWMLIDEGNRFLTQREHPDMCLLQVGAKNNGWLIHPENNSGSALFIPHSLPSDAPTVRVQIWDDVCEAQPAGKEINEWFSAILKMRCRLVYMPESTNRRADEKYAVNGEITSFSDAYPILLIGQASLEELNTRLTEPVPMNRFRPSIVFEGGRPFEEDSLEEFVINGIRFFGVKLCSRCVVTTINHSNAVKGKEPLKTLATYRMKNNKVYFGQNLLHRGMGIISAGDRIEVVKTKQGFLTG